MFSGWREVDHRSFEPVFGGVYKLVAMEENARLSQDKISENIEKITTPGFKKLFVS